MSVPSPLPKSRPPVTIRLGPGRSFELATDAVLEAFFATVSYRLEPDGWATRFPLTLDHLRAGTLGPAESAGTVAELETIGRELRALPVRKAVWDYQDTRPCADHGQPVNAGAGNLHDYFVAADGRTPLVQRLRELAEASREVRDDRARGDAVSAQAAPQRAVSSHAGTRRRHRRACRVSRFHPDAQRQQGRPAALGGRLPHRWVGSVAAAGSPSPALADRRRRHPWIAASLGGATVAAVLFFSWRDAGDNKASAPRRPPISPRAAPTPAAVFHRSNPPVRESTLTTRL